MLGYLIIIRPFKYIMNNALEIFNESCVLASSLIMLSWTYFPDYEGNQLNNSGGSPLDDSETFN